MPSLRERHLSVADRSAGAATSAGLDMVALAALLGAGAMLGLTATSSKVAADLGISPLAFLTWPVVGAGSALRVVGRANRRPPDRELIGYLVVAGLITVAVPQLILFTAVSRVGVGFVALAVAFPPLFTYLGSVALGGERLRLDRSLGATAVVVGAAIMAAAKLSEPEAPVGWIALTSVVPILLAAGNLFRTRRWPTGRDGGELASGMLLAAGVMLAPFAFVSGLDLAVPLGPRAVALVVAQTVVFVVQFALFFVVQRRGGPVFLSLLGSVGAVVGTVIAVVVLGESLPVVVVPATVLIALGMRQLVRG